MSDQLPDAGVAFTQVPQEYAPPFHHTLGVKMGIGENGEGIAWIDVDPERHYGNRWAHGGIAGALADISSGIAIARTVRDGYTEIDGTIEMKVNFLRKIVEGDMTATARLLHAGRRVAVAEVDITNKGTLCAKALVTFMLRREEA